MADSSPEREAGQTVLRSMEKLMHDTGQLFGKVGQPAAIGAVGAGAWSRRRGICGVMLRRQSVQAWIASSLLVSIYLGAHLAGE